MNKLLLIGSLVLVPGLIGIIFNMHIAETITPHPSQASPRSFGQALHQLGEALSYPAQVRANGDIVRNVSMVISLLGAVLIGVSLVKSEKAD